MPVSPGLRHLQRPLHDHLHKKGPYRPLTIAKRGKGGRNHTGKITCRHRGGGHRRRIRTLDYDRKEPGRQTVVRIERDPGRSGHIALIKHDETGKLSYILAAEGLRAGDAVESYRAGIPKKLLEKMGGIIDPGIMAFDTIVKGNCLPLSLIPTSTIVYALGLRPNEGAKLCRAAGASAVVLNHHGDFTDIKLRSGEVRRFKNTCCASIGVMSNAAHQHTKYGKAGRVRWLGIRPTVRGVAQNAVDHPHGGGRGKSKGNKHPRSTFITIYISDSILGPWGWKTKGFRTRRRISKWVVVSRPRNKEKLGKEIMSNRIDPSDAGQQGGGPQTEIQEH
jgi:ribosomal protein L2